MKKFQRPKASKRDFISDMPDAILVLILSRLQYTEEVIRTSVLSTRWRYVWNSIPSLNLHLHYGYGGKFEKNKFKEFVDRVLLNKSVDLDSFRLNCWNHYSMSTVGQWIHAAVMINVKQLDLAFRPKETGDVEIPHCLVTCGSLEKLKLDLTGRGLRLPNFMGFSSLRVLDLACVDLLGDEGLVKDFLGRCSLLEDLRLLNCVISKLDTLYISCPKLKKLRIENYGEERMCGDIKISCLKLVFLALTGYTYYNFYDEILDYLEEDGFEPEDLISNTKCVLFPGISHVESLLIDFHFFYKCICAATDPSLPKLKTLELSTTIDAFTFDEFIKILKYYPNLDFLNLIIREDRSGWADYWECEGDPRRMLTCDMEKIEDFEFNGEKPKQAIDWGENQLFKMVFSWDTKPRDEQKNVRTRPGRKRPRNWIRLL